MLMHHRASVFLWAIITPSTLVAYRTEALSAVDALARFVGRGRGERSGAREGAPVFSEDYLSAFQGKKARRA